MRNKRTTSAQQQGLSGWLSPEGVFTSASHDKYDEVARVLERNRTIKPVFDDTLSYNFIHGERLLELSGYMKFTYYQMAKDNYKEHVDFPEQFGLNKDVTSKQIDWLESNFHKMTSSQETFVKLYLKSKYNRR